MESKSMTALVSAFARAYHVLNNEVTIFNDSVARQLLTDDEFNQIARDMSAGIGYFNPTFAGNAEQALRWIVDNQLSPSPLGRAAFAEKSLELAACLGAEQYLILGAGYDTFAYRQPLWAEKLDVFEIDHPITARDKQERLKRSGIVIPDNVHYIEADFTKETWNKALQDHCSLERDKISFCSILGVAYYLSRESFELVISSISDIMAKGSSIVFDYPDEKSYTEKAGERAQKQFMLAGGAHEKMLAAYSYFDIEQLLSSYGLLIYEHLEPQEITKQYFTRYNDANPTNRMVAFDNTNYCLAVRQ
jgi:methyltransferase (TIGR00027 family)